MLRNIFTIVMIVGIGATSYSQGSIWSLERCVNYSQQNNLNIQQSSIAVKQAELSLESNKREFYPTLNGSVSYGFNSGRSIDPTTNDFVAQSIHTNGVSLSAGALVYSGGRVSSQIAQNEYNIQAAKLDVESTKNDIGLQVARGYLQILLAEEQLANSQVNLKQLNDQLAQTNKLIRAGTLPANNRLDIEAQIAASEQTLVANQNTVDIAYLSLKLLLQLEPNTPFQVEKPTDLEIPSSDQLAALSVNGIYELALQNQPNIAAGDLRTKSAEKSIDIAKSALYPTVTVGGGLSTNYSNIGIDAANPDVIFAGNDTINTEIIANGQSTMVGIVSPNFNVSFPKANYFQQFGNNLSGFVGIQVNIPIYNGGQTNISIEQAKLGVINTQYTNRIMRQNLKADVLRALADAKAASKQLEAAEKSVAAQQAAFENTKKRFDVGTANSFEFNTSRNNLEGAKALYVLAKYDYIFKLKILDFYQGKPLNLK